MDTGIPSFRQIGTGLAGLGFPVGNRAGQVRLVAQEHLSEAEHSGVCSGPAAGLPVLALPRALQRHRAVRTVSTSSSRRATVTLEMISQRPAELWKRGQSGEESRSQTSAGKPPLRRAAGTRALPLRWPGGGPEAKVSVLEARPSHRATPSGPASSVKQELRRCLQFRSVLCSLTGLLRPCFGVCAHLSCVPPLTILGPSSSPSAPRCEIQLTLGESWCHLTNSSVHNKRI